MVVLHHTWLSGYCPFVRFTKANVITSPAGAAGMLPGPQKGVVSPRGRVVALTGPVGAETPAGLLASRRSAQLLTICSTQPLTVIPIERAVPSMIFSAAAIELAFRSAILTWAMSRTWALVTEPTFVLCGSPLPFWTPAAFLISSGAGGVLVMKENDRSS